MLKNLRVSISIVLFALITFYFLDISAVLPDRFHVLAHIQLVPAILSGSFIILAALIILTLLFGRVYCSSICPMGVYQDIVSWFSKRKIFSKKKKRYKYSKAKNILRWSVLGVTIVTFFLNLPLLLGLIDPYSAYGRMAANVFKPVYMAGNNVLKSIFTSFGNYTFYQVEIVILSLFALITGIVTFLAIGFLAWKYGRTYCNTICPVGTVLGFLSKFSLFKVRIDENQCNKCGACAGKCKASCIDSKNHSVDYSRCVACFNCLDSCSQNALKFSPSIKNKKQEVPQTTDMGKRQFLMATLTTAVTVPTAYAQEKTARLSGIKVPTRQTPISPPGSQSAKHLLDHCTSCHLCVSKCPSHVIKPAFMEYGLGGIMQPIMNYENGFCNYNCTICADICPNRALLPLTQDKKHMLQIGRVTFTQDICIVHTEKTNCGACAEHCPTQAVTMIPYEGHGGLTIPHTNPDICVGCGGCEYICPVRPRRAIFVEGNKEHHEREAFKEEKKENIEVKGFGF
jgi:ferredoxin